MGSYEEGQKGGRGLPEGDGWALRFSGTGRTEIALVPVQICRRTRTLSGSASIRELCLLKEAPSLSGCCCPNILQENFRWMFERECWEAREPKKIRAPLFFISLLSKITQDKRCRFILPHRQHDEVIYSQAF